MACVHIATELSTQDHLLQNASLDLSFSFVSLSCSKMAIRSPRSLLPSPSSHKLYPSITKPPTPSPLHFKTVAVSTIPRVSIGDDLPDDYANWVPVCEDTRNLRRAGVLLHPTSFRGPYGIGDLGYEAFRFIDWLHLSGCSLWQVSTSALLYCQIPNKKSTE